MKLWLAGLLFMLSASTTAIAKDSSTIKGEIKDVDLCGSVILETVCSFEVPDLNRRRRRLGGGGGDNQAKNMENVIHSCKVKLDGDDVESTVTVLDYCELKFDESVKGDDVKLLIFASQIQLNNSTINGLVKLEAFEYDNSHPDSNQAMTTVKTFSIAWSGC